MFFSKIRQRLHEIRYASRTARNIFTDDFVRENDYRISKCFKKKLKKDWQNFSSAVEPYPNIFSGRGIVICAGGLNYVTCAWVCVAMLRKQGCVLPVELWFDGDELNSIMIDYFNKMGVTCKNCRDYAIKKISGYAIKPFAILNSSFKEILFLDADNNCLKDPSYLFESQHYKETGAIFWPDSWTTSSKNPIWDIIGTNEYDSKEQESGQILIDKEKCWRELNLCMFFNRHNQYYYQMLLGDKDTFKFSWLALGKQFYMVKYPLAYCGFLNHHKGFCGVSMIQHDFDGEMLFLHRNLLKWGQSLDGEILCTHVKKIKSNKGHVKFVPKSVDFESSRQHYVDIDGEVNLFLFDDHFPGYENECLQILKDFRQTDVYREFMLYLYLVKFRPGYAKYSII